ncbi:MAG TPA: D-glycerate dehydrogenase [Ilumatobacteraceae bacterium]|jgi:glyoxylate reductase|nr:D-glycerate dehydrogenase [Ilumatobacteraceae bacterium]
MAQPRIIVAGRIPDAGLDVLRPHGNVWGWKHDEPIEVDELYERIENADAVLTLLTTKVDRAFLEAAGPRLKVVSNVAVGYNNIDVAACRDHGVVATNTPGVLTDATADIAMALILMVTRRLGEGERIVRSNKPWQWGMFMLLGTSLQGRRLGIVGMGAIGQALARRAKAFGMTVAYSNRSAVSLEIEADLGAERLNLDEMLATSDVVSINCPYSAETHHLIGAEQFELMRSSAYLVNTARGPIVDETALVTALRSGAIAGAGLDVYEHEPLLAPGLDELDNAVLIPHLGSATIETRAAMATLAARNTVAVLTGQPALTPIT